MKKISILALYLLCISTPLFGIEEREGFYKQLYEPATVLTVPAGKKFVIMQLLTRESVHDWNLKVDDIVIFNNKIFGRERTTNASGLAIVANFDITFPDRCVTIEQGKTLVYESSYNIYLTIVGYFYNCNCPSIPVADLNKDCKVDVLDLAIMASEWLIDNTT